MDATSNSKTAKGLVDLLMFTLPDYCRGWDRVKQNLGVTQMIAQT